MIVAVVMEAFDGCLLDRPVHAFDLPIGPGMVRLRQAVLDPVGLADHVEAHRPGDDRVSVPRLLGELDAVVGQDGVGLVGYGFEHMLEELPCRPPIGLLDELGDGELAGSVDAHEEVELARRSEPPQCRCERTRSGIA